MLAVAADARVSGEATEGEPVTVHESGAEAAVRAWAAAYDDEGEEWRIVAQGRPVAVWCEGGGRVDASMPGGRHPAHPPRLFRVSGEWVRKYFVEEVVA